MADDPDKIESQSDKKKPFFSASYDNSAASFDNAGEVLGGQIGPYKLLSILGEGGYGIVYLAEQQEPIKRKVALKIIKPGMDTKEVIARFEAERQALALLDHPNIAHVYDAGTTETGHPYFVMEYVKGMVITDYCDWQQLGIEDRLKLFLEVCNAIQYAHRKGIIHRDIKPSNILISIEGEGVVPKVIDLGVVKAINQPLTERTLYTEQGQFIGTPEYMSPEQAGITTQDIDTRSDVYSLGVVLYELLTGVLPFDPQMLREAGIDRLLQIIREEEPKTPSTRFSLLGEKAVQIAAKRRTEAGTLAHRLHKELEWIPMKAMRKERTRRYQSVSELADDIQNYLNGNPLIAGPESVTYKLKKYIRKHRRFVAAAAIVTMAVLVGLVISITMYFRAEEARITEAEQRKIADAERDRAIKAEQEAMKHLVDLYEQQGRSYMESGDLDKALVFLSEACNIDNQRLSVRLLLAECMRKHENPAFRKDDGLIPWDKGVSKARISAFSVSPDRTCVAFVDGSLGVINVFDTTTGKLMAQFPAKTVTGLVFTPGSRHMIVKAEQDSNHHTLKVFNIQNGKEVFSKKRSNTDIERLYQSVDYALPDRGRLAKVYDSLYMSPKGDWFAFVDVIDSDVELKPEICLWDCKSNKLYRTQSLHFNSLISVLLYIPESVFGHVTRLVTLDCHGLAQYWDLPTLESIGESRAFASTLSGIMDSKKYILFADKGATLYDRRANRNIKTFPTAVCAGFSPNGKRIVTKQTRESSHNDGSPDLYYSTNLWDADGQHIAELNGKGLQNWHFTPDSNFLITEHADAQINVWNIGNGSLVFSIPSDDTQAVADISPDSCWLVTSSGKEPGKTHIWNIATGKSFEPYQDEAWGQDLAAAWLSVDMDRVFAFSHTPSEKLLRFNAEGSHLITGAGLRGIAPEDRPSEHIRKLVDAYIDLRLENGKIRTAPTKELLQAKLDYYVMQKGQEAPETIGIVLDLVTYAIQVGELEEASKLAIDLELLQSRGNTELAQRGRSIIEQLSKAYTSRADQEHRRGKYAAAVANYESALQFDPNNPFILKELAWLQATCSDSGLPNIDKAIERAKKACELTNWKHWECLSTHAVACAARGEYKSAIDYQRESIELLPPEQRDKWGANYQERLRLFRSSQQYQRKLFWNLPTDNMIAWWKLDEAKGADVVDSSGNGLGGRLVGAACIIEDAERGGVLSIDSEGGHVNCGNNPAFDITDSITLAAWVKVDVFDKESQAIFSKGESAWRLRRSWTRHTLSFSCDGLQGLSTPGTGVEGKENVNDGKWHHIVATYNGTILALYTDGVLDNSKSARGQIKRSDSAVWIGGNADRATEKGRDWNGRIDDVRIYSRALTSDEVRELYEATK